MKWINENDEMMMKLMKMEEMMKKDDEIDEKWW